MKKLVSMVAVFALLIGVWWVYGKVSVVETKVTAVAGEFEESFNAKGIIIRNEYPIISDMKGTLHSRVQNGTRVTKGTNVANVYLASADSEMVTELSEVTDAIAEIENMQDGTILSLTDVDEINARITTYSNQLAELSESGNYEKIRVITKEINALISRKNYLEGDASEDFQDIESLKNKKTELEGKLEGKTDPLKASISGLYYDFTDGYEGLDISSVNDISENTVNKVMEGKKVDGAPKNGVCKVVDNSGWVVSIVTDKKNIQGMEEGSRIQLRFNGSEDNPVDADIHSIKYNGKKVILNIEGTSYVENIYSERVCTVDVIKNTYSGLTIPEKAIAKRNDMTYVKVQTSGGVVEKKVSVLCIAPDGTAIVKMGIQSGELLLYDEVVYSTNRQEVKK